MSYILTWDSTALDTYFEEIDFILYKWNVNEVKKFKDLVNENLERLTKNPEIGIFNFKHKVYSLVISKQTTLYYDFNSITNQIELIVFWNNLKNPDDLTKLL